jgi:hypothetical protein
MECHSDGLQRLTPEFQHQPQRKSNIQNYNMRTQEFKPEVGAGIITAGERQLEGWSICGLGHWTWHRPQHTEGWQPLNLARHQWALVGAEQKNVCHLSICKHQRLF